jgi:triacylglycerol esterase/lipase EstA (alpha/beta hydrolase family)
MAQGKEYTETLFPGLRKSTVFNITLRLHTIFWRCVQRMRFRKLTQVHFCDETIADSYSAMADDKFKGEVLAAWSARIKSSAWQRQVSYIDKAVRGQLWSIHKKRYARATLQDDLVKVANQLKMELQCQGIEWGTQEAQKHTQKIVQQRGKREYPSLPAHRC